MTTEYVRALTGATVELRCTDPSSRHSAVYWRRDGLDIETTPGNRFQLSLADNALDIVDIQLSDAGTYSCYVVDAFGDGQRKRYVVQVIGISLMSDFAEIM